MFLRKGVGESKRHHYIRTKAEISTLRFAVAQLGSAKNAGTVYVGQGSELLLEKPLSFASNAGRRLSFEFPKLLAAQEPRAMMH